MKRKGQSQLKRIIMFLNALFIVAAIIPMGIGTVAHAQPIESLTPIYITQNGGSDPTYGPTISAVNFAALLNVQHLNTPDKIYTLLEDIIIDATLLVDTYFTQTLYTENFVFYGSLEGNGHTITVDTNNLPAGKTARALFFDIGSLYRIPSGGDTFYSADQYIQDLTIRYNGDVLGSGFAHGSIYNTDIDNVEIIIEGDILPDRNYAAAGGALDTYTHYQVATGFAYRIQGHAESGATEDTSMVNKTISNVTVTACNIGNDITKDFDPAAYPLIGVSGFVDLVGPGVDFLDITLNYENMFLRTITKGQNNSYAVAGFSKWVQNTPIQYVNSSGGNVGYGPVPKLDNISVNVTGDMHIVYEDYAYLGFGYTGIFGVAGWLQNLTNSSVKVDGNMIAETLDNQKTETITRDAACVMGIGTAFNEKRPGDTGPQFVNNTVTVGGDAIMRSHGNNVFVGGVASASFSNGYSSQNNTVIFKGNVTMERIGQQMADNIESTNSFFGMDHRMVSSTNNSLTIGGKVKSHQKGGRAFIKNVKGEPTLFGSHVTFSGNSAYCGEVTGSSTSITGGVDLYAEHGIAVLYGFGATTNSTALLNFSDNKFTVGGNISSKTDDAQFAAYFMGYLYSIGDATAPTTRTIENNEVSFAGNITVEAPNNAYLLGFAYNFAEQAQARNNKLYVGGDMTATVNQSLLDADSALVCGFAAQLSGSAENNSVHIAGDINVNSTTNAEFEGFVSGVPATATLTENIVRIDGGVTAESTSTEATQGVYAAGFASTISGEVQKNAVFIKDGITVNASSPTVTELGTFALLADSGSAVTENTVIGKPGVPELYNGFILEVDAAADASNNFFTSALGGQRVSNLLNYSTTSFQFEPASTAKRERLIVSDATTFAANPTYIAENGLSGALSLGGPDATGSTLGANRLQTSAALAALSLGTQQGGLHAVMDLPGIAYPYASNRISGTIYHDPDDLGSQATPVSGITINVKLGGTAIASGVTNAAGKYDIEMPLFSCLPLEYTIELVVPANYTLGTASANAFAGTGSIIGTLGYTADHINDGYLAGEGGGNPVIPPIIPGGDDKPEVNGKDHFAYITGYPDETVRPTANITRAEVATIYFRLLTEESRNNYWHTNNTYSDVHDESWFNTAVSTMTKAKIITGYPDGTFGGDLNITRAEFAAIAARFDSDAYTGADKFSDVSGHWAAEYINRASEKGWILGYPDGSFKPDQYISRAEAITMINRMLNRSSIKAMHEDMRVWIDNPTTEWYHEAVQEATNSHNYTRDASGYETWMKVVSPPDWQALERSWAAAKGF